MANACATPAKTASLPEPFPLKFDPSAWKGPRARQFTDRSDAFQQLVGDALREQFGCLASVSPTEGRDGSIDAFVDRDTNCSSGFAGLPAPQIIECKDHDDTRNGYLANISAGWARVADKLAKQAAGGWTGRFQPWRRAKSYVYCVSAVLPNQQERDSLHQRIVGFFDGLPPDQRPPLELIRVLDWTDLRDLLDRLARVADRWLGTGLPLLPSHAEYCAGLTRFRRYLLEGHLPFVAPEITDKSHPRFILSRLEALAGSGGVLLKGVGGVGKTRLALEVAWLADAAGWRVLHVLPGEPGVTVEDLTAVVFSGGTPTLLVFDYLDQMPKLDLASLRRRLLPEADRRDLRLAMLANLRPSALRRPNPERDALFTEEVLLQPSAEQKAGITELALERIAPLAVARFGREQVRDLCGERPTIAMFVAEELQRRAVQGTLAAGTLAGLRQGGLLGWLRKRLTEDGLVVDGGAGFLPPQPEPALLAAAAMLAAAPLSRYEMVETGRFTCEAAGEDGTRMAEPVLERLLSLGWIEPRDVELAAAHDVVADEVLAQVLWDRSGGQLRAPILFCCLAPALNRARVLGRYATALTRLPDPETAGTDAEAALHEQAGLWLQGNADCLGRMLAAVEVGEAAYAMGAVVSAPAWSSVCVARWPQLIAPWLNVHGAHPEARHLLYRGLKELPAQAEPELLTAAMNWLPINICNETASYVLGPLLARTDLDNRATAAIDLAMAWLNQFGETIEAGYLFHPLLARTDLGTNATEAIDLAMDWLKQFGKTIEAGYVFDPLLARTDLGTHATSAIDLAMAWLNQLGRTMEAGFVLPPLLARADLGTHATGAIDLAMAWLNQFGRTIEAGFVLPPLLARTDLDTHATSAIDLTMAWLKQFGRTIEAPFVLHPLLARADLATHATAAIDLAMDWLNQFGKTIEAPFVLKRLFGKHGLSKAQRDQCVRHALPHLKRLSTTPEASHILQGCLKDRDLEQGPARLVVHYALAWIRNNPYDEGADYIFNRLLRRPDLSDIHWKKAASIALAWLRRHTNRGYRDLSLAALLSRPEKLEVKDLNWVVKEAENCIANPPKADPSPKKLIAALERFHRKQFQGDRPPRDSGWIDKSAVEQLDLAARGKAKAPGKQQIETLLNAMTAAVDTSRPTPAAYPLPALLALVQPIVHPQLWTQLVTIARRILAHPRFLPFHREVLAKKAWSLVDCGAWPEYQAKPTLDDLGLPRPDTRQPRFGSPKPFK